MQGSSPPSLIASDLASRRGDRVLFRRLSIELGQGDALHVTGANGSGKTTLMRTLAGLMTPFEGGVEAAGAIGLLDDRPALDPELPLGKALAFWERMDGCVDPNATVQKLGLNTLLDVPIQYLSTGQKKRAALASLLNRSVPIWLLDEPLSGLDKGAIERVNTLIEEHISSGGIAVIASHQELAVDRLQSLAIEDYAP